MTVRGERIQFLESHKSMALVTFEASVPAGKVAELTELLRNASEHAATPLVERCLTYHHTLTLITTAKTTNRPVDNKALKPPPPKAPRPRASTTSKLVKTHTTKIDISNHAKPRRKPRLKAHQLLSVDVDESADDFVPLLLGSPLVRASVRVGTLFEMQQQGAVRVFCEQELEADGSDAWTRATAADGGPRRLEACFLESSGEAERIASLVRSADELLSWLEESDVVREPDDSG